MIRKSTAQTIVVSGLRELRLTGSYDATKDALRTRFNMLSEAQLGQYMDIIVNAASGGREANDAPEGESASELMGLVGEMPGDRFVEATISWDAGPGNTQFRTVRVPYSPSDTMGVIRDRLADAVDEMTSEAHERERGDTLPPSDDLPVSITIVAFL